MPTLAVLPLTYILFRRPIVSQRADQQLIFSKKYSAQTTGSQFRQITYFFA